LGNGNSFFASGGRGNKKAQLKYCLRVLRSVINTNSEQAIQDLTDQDGLTLLTKIIKAYSLNNEHQNDQLDVEIQTDVLFIISGICENDLHRKVFFFKTSKIFNVITSTPSLKQDVEVIDLVAR
jgi:hypothetical protein